MSSLITLKPNFAAFKLMKSSFAECSIIISVLITFGMRLYSHHKIQDALHWGQTLQPWRWKWPSVWSTAIIIKKWHIRQFKNLWLIFDYLYSSYESEVISFAIRPLQFIFFFFLGFKDSHVIHRSTNSAGSYKFWCNLYRLDFLLLLQIGYVISFKKPHCWWLMYNKLSCNIEILI